MSAVTTTSRPAAAMCARTTAQRRSRSSSENAANFGSRHSGGRRGRGNRAGEAVALERVVGHRDTEREPYPPITPAVQLHISTPELTKRLADQCTTAGRSLPGE